MRGDTGYEWAKECAEHLAVNGKVTTFVIKTDYCNEFGYGTKADIEQLRQNKFIVSFKKVLQCNPDGSSEEVNNG